MPRQQAKRPVKKASTKPSLVRKKSVNRLTMSLVAIIAAVTGITAVAISQASTGDPATMASPAPTSPVTAQSTRYSQEFENSFDGWTSDHYLACEADTSAATGCTNDPLVWAITRSKERPNDGVYGLKFKLDGVHGDGTTWVEKQFSAQPNSTVHATLSFSLWSKVKTTFGPWYVAGYAGATDPKAETDFTNLGATELAAGWKKYTLTKTVQTDATGKVWVGFGLSALHEDVRTYYIDSVDVSLN